MYSPDNFNKYSFDEIYNIFSNILSGCRTMLDALHFAEKILKNNEEYKELIIGMIHNKRYDKVLDFRTIAHTLNELNEVEYREDIDEFIDKNLKNNIDNIQLNSILRLSKVKTIKTNKIVNEPKKIKLNSVLSDINDASSKIFEVNNNISIHKSCPHCNLSLDIPKDSIYVICGYLNTKKGFDWLGCGKDWCGKCNKMLCKSWEQDNLTEDKNRIHTVDCCRKYAKKNKIDPKLFCSCDKSI